MLCWRRGLFDRPSSRRHPCQSWVWVPGRSVRYLGRVQTLVTVWYDSLPLSGIDALDEEAAVINRIQKKSELPADCYIYKHSTACPVSMTAAQVVESLEFDLPLYWVDVIEQRKLSNQIAIRYGVRHESPQFLRINRGRATVILNHNQISPAQIAQAMTV